MAHSLNYTTKFNNVFFIICKYPPASLGALMIRTQLIALSRKRESTPIDTKDINSVMLSGHPDSILCGHPDSNTVNA